MNEKLIVINFQLLAQVRTLYPLVKDSCDKLADYLKTIPPNKDVEAKAVSLRNIKFLLAIVFKVITFN